MGENERYIMAEFQDDKGNIIYWHTDARVVWLPDGTSLYAYMDADVADLVIFTSPVIIALTDLEQLICRHGKYRQRHDQDQVRQNALPLFAFSLPSAAPVRPIRRICSSGRPFAAACRIDRKSVV